MNMRKYIQSFIAGITAFTCLSVHAEGEFEGIKHSTSITTEKLMEICDNKANKLYDKPGKFYYFGTDPNIIVCAPDGKPDDIIFVLRKHMTYLQWVQAKIGNVIGFNQDKVDDIIINLFDNKCLNDRFLDITGDGKLTQSGKKNLLNNPIVKVIPAEELRSYIVDSLKHCHVDLSKQKYESDKKAIDAIKAIVRPSDD